MNFLVTNGQKKYVVRFIRNKSQRGREEDIYNSKIASNGGYGPQIYYADPSQAVIIMEYLSGKSVSDQEVIEYISGKEIPNQNLQSNQFYIALAHFLQKIHRGHAFKGGGDYVLRRIHEELETAKLKYSKFVPVTKIECIITVIRQAILPHLTSTTPCHNDLHSNNLMLLGNEFKAIDYETAGQGDPYFDVATVVASLYCKPAHEIVLFTTYLGRQSSKAEEAKLCLIKQIIWIKWFFDDLRWLSPENIQKFGRIKTLPLIDLAREVVEGKIDMSKSENKLKLLKARLNQIFANCESQEFRDAVKMLSNKK